MPPALSMRYTAPGDGWPFSSMRAGADAFSSRSALALPTSTTVPMRPSAPATPSVESAARAASRLSPAATVTLITPVYAAPPIVTFVPGANVTVALSIVTTV